MDEGLTQESYLARMQRLKTAVYSLIGEYTKKETDLKMVATLKDSIAAIRGDIEKRTELESILASLDPIPTLEQEILVLEQNNAKKRVLLETYEFSFAQWRDRLRHPTMSVSEIKSTNLN